MITKQISSVQHIKIRCLQTHSLPPSWTEQAGALNIHIVWTNCNLTLLVSDALWRRLRLAGLSPGLSLKRGKEHDRAPVEDLATGWTGTWIVWNISEPSLTCTPQNYPKDGLHSSDTVSVYLHPRQNPVQTNAACHTHHRHLTAIINPVIQSSNNTIDSVVGETNTYIFPCFSGGLSHLLNESHYRHVGPLPKDTPLLFLEVCVFSQIFPICVHTFRVSVVCGWQCDSLFTNSLSSAR